MKKFFLAHTMFKYLIEQQKHVLCKMLIDNREWINANTPKGNKNV